MGTKNNRLILVILNISVIVTFCFAVYWLSDQTIEVENATSMSNLSSTKDPEIIQKPTVRAAFWLLGIDEGTIANHNGIVLMVILTSLAGLLIVLITNAAYGLFSGFIILSVSAFEALAGQNQAILWVTFLVMGITMIFSTLSTHFIVLLNKKYRNKNSNLHTFVTKT